MKDSYLMREIFDDEYWILCDFSEEDSIDAVSFITDMCLSVETIESCHSCFVIMLNDKL